jgi:hypothetical protein
MRLSLPSFCFPVCKTGLSPLKKPVSLKISQADLLFMTKKVKDFKIHPTASRATSFETHP